MTLDELIWSDLQIRVKENGNLGVDGPPWLVKQERASLRRHKAELVEQLSPPKDRSDHRLVLRTRHESGLIVETWRSPRGEINLFRTERTVISR